MGPTDSWMEVGSLLMQNRDRTLQVLKLDATSILPRCYEQILHQVLIFGRLNHLLR